MKHAASAQAKAVPAEPLGLYVHVPFCASSCDFCAFYQIAPTAELVQRYLTGLEREAGLLEWPRPVTTVYWGGGTPGLLSPGDLRRLGEIVLARTGGAPAEWTVELAPGSVTEARLAVLHELGVTRLSMGVQSFQPELLDALGRRHSPAQVHRAYARMRTAGFTNVNLDLMFALPGQTDAQREADVAAAVALQPEHISAYCLTLEEDTALWLKLAQGKVRQDEESESRQYLAMWAQLEAAGYAQYEVSNFARPGHACRHNLNTWRMGEWIGLGPAAASQHNGWRAANVAHLGRWEDGLQRGERMTEDRLRLSPEQLAEDALIFGLRLNAGVNVAAWRAAVPDAPWDEVERTMERLVGDGLMQNTNPTWRLTTKGRLLADAVARELMEAFQTAACA